MSSFDARGIRPASNDPLLQIFVELQKQVVKSIRDGQVELLDSDNEDIFSDGQDIDTAIKYHSELSSTHKFNFNTDYYPPEEPNGTTCKLMLKGWNTGNVINDESGFNHNAAIWGDPTLVDGTLDLGIWTGPSSVKSIALRMNRPTSELENQEWVQVADHADLRVTGLTTGQSIFIAFRLFSLADQNGRAPTILEKTDDATPSNAYMLQAKSDGKLVFITTKAGVTTAKETAAGTVTTNTVYYVYITFTVSGAVAHIYVNGTDKSLTTFAGSVNWQTDLTNHDLYIFRRGAGTLEGCVYGDLYFYRHFKERVISSTEVTQHQANKWTIANIPFGKVMITGYWATYQDTTAILDIPSFDPISFDPISFTTTVTGTGDSFTEISFSSGSFT